MIPLLTREAVRAIDADAVARLRVPSIVLMENAGRGATDVLVSKMHDRLPRVVAVGGPGQNGGDAWVVARHLQIRGFSCRAVVVGDPAKIVGDAAVNLESLRALGAVVDHAPLEALDPLRSAVDQATLLVDGLFGTGLDRPLTGGWAEAIRIMNASTAARVSLDLPSGIDSDTGQVLGIAVESSLTTTFAAHKRGLHQHPGVDHAGDVVLVSIGVPFPETAPAFLFEPEDVATALPLRPRDAHKGTAGRVLVVGGSEGRTGAGLLTGHGALRAGAGLVTIATRAARAMDAKVIELMTAQLPDKPTEAVDACLDRARAIDAVAVGPGLGLDDFGRTVAMELALRLPIPTVLDADALTALGEAGLAHLRGATAPRVLTPHPGEAARLLRCNTADVQRDRYAAARRLADESGHVVALKGARTVVASPSGPLTVCRRGTAAMGVAGTGDVLTGIVAALLATLQPHLATSVAVCVHALGGELASRCDRGLFAREIADALPRAIANCRAASTRLGTGPRSA